MERSRSYHPREIFSHRRNGFDRRSLSRSFRHRTPARAATPRQRQTSAHNFGEDTDDTVALTAMLSHLSQKACKRLREAGLATRTLTLTIRYTGFDTYTRSKTLGEPTQLDADIFAVLQKLFHANRNHGCK